MHRILLVALLVSVSGAASAQDEPAEFTLEREELVNLGSTLVVRLAATIPGVQDAEMTRMVYAFQHAPAETKVFSSDESNGIWPRGEVRRAEVLIVAQVARGSADHPPMLMLSVRQRSGESGEKGGSYSFFPVPLEKDRSLEDLIEITVEPGRYPIGKQIEIGTLGEDPICFSVGPEPGK